MEKENLDKELAEQLRMELLQIDTCRDGQALIRELRRYADVLNLGSRLPVRLQLVYYRMAFHVFNYLRRKGQLRQTRQVFDEDVYNSLMNVLQVLDNELRN